MKAALVSDEGTFRVEDLPEPTPGDNDLVLRVTGCGICASDLKTRPFLPAGTVMGHELCGEVVAVGKDARSTWREGAHATALPLFTCGTCTFCSRGEMAHCPSISMIGLGGAPGGFAELAVVSAALSTPLPASLPAAFGPLVEPFAVGLHNVEIGGISKGDDVLVVGGGAVGLATAAWAHHHGARTVTVADPHQNRREAAIQLGATSTIDSRNEPLGGPYDVVVECVGRPGLIDACAGAAQALGRVVVAGVCAEPDPFVPLGALLKELSIRFALYYRPTEFEAVVRAFESGAIDPLPLLSRTVGLEDLDATFLALETTRDDLKVVVSPGSLI